MLFEAWLKQKMLTMDVPLKKPVPIRHEEFAQLMGSLGPFEPYPSCAVALSGGPDSLVLTLLLEKWIKDRKGSLKAITVDHGLRSHSQEEARSVGSWMKELNISHVILKWRGEKPSSHLQEKARLMRHSLLEEYCKDHKIFHLFFAHHAEDQQETFLLRFFRKSGIDGLSAMQSLREGLYSRKLRPLLRVSKERIFATLEELDHPFVKDPSNQDLKFERARLRAQKEKFQDLGFAPSIFEHVIEKNLWVREALEKETVKALFSMVNISPYGYVCLNLKEFQELSFEIARRVLERILLMMGDKIYTPRTESLLPLVRMLRESPESFITKTLHHSLLKKKKDTLFILREEMQKKELFLKLDLIPNMCQNSSKFIWGDRFLITLNSEKRIDFPTRFLAPLTKLGLLYLKRQAQEKDFLSSEKIPQDIWEDVLISLPALWEKNQLLSLPNLGWGMDFWEESGFKSSPPSFFPKNPLSPPFSSINFMEKIV